jgi:hypothetical protein
MMTSNACDAGRLQVFSQPEGGKNKKSTRLAFLLSTWRGDLDHLYR